MYGKSLPTRESVGGGQRSEMDKKAALPLLSLHALSEMERKAALLLLSLHALGILHLVYLIFIRNSYRYTYIFQKFLKIIANAMGNI